MDASSLTPNSGPGDGLCGAVAPPGAEERAQDVRDAQRASQAPSEASGSAENPDAGASGPQTDEQTSGGRGDAETPTAAAGGRTAPPSDAEALDAAYRERAHLVALLAAHYPAVTAPAPDVDEDGWVIAYLTIGGHQASWHISPRDLDLFGHVTHVPADDPRAQWDGHTTDEKHQRIRQHTQDVAAAAARHATQAEEAEACAHIGSRVACDDTATITFACDTCGTSWSRPGSTRDEIIPDPDANRYLTAAEFMASRGTPIDHSAALGLLLDSLGISDREAGATRRWVTPSFAGRAAPAADGACVCSGTGGIPGDGTCAIHAPAPDSRLLDEIAGALEAVRCCTAITRLTDAVMPVVTAWRDRELEQARELLREATAGAETADELWVHWQQRAEKAEAAIARVRKLHRPTDTMAGPRCAGCMDCDPFEAYKPDECPTIRALDTPPED